MPRERSGRLDGSTERTYDPERLVEHSDARRSFLDYTGPVAQSGRGGPHDGDTRVESELERLRKKVENFPSASLYNRLAELERLNGNGAEADTVCRKCIREFPRNGQAYVILAELQLAAGSRSEAQTLLHTAIERDARCYAGYRLLADLLVDGKDVPKDVPKAIWLLQQILTFKPNDPR